MKKGPKIFIIILLFSIIFIPKGVFPISITVTGSWSENIDNFDMQGGAGTDLISTYESASNACTIDVTGAAKKDWDIDISKVDTLWHANFHLYVRRTSDGTGDPNTTISGGGTYQEITDIDQTFFSGTKDRTGIEVQYQLGGVSVQVPPNTYTTTVYYTVIKY